MLKKPDTLTAIQVLAWIMIGFSFLDYLLLAILLNVPGTTNSEYYEFRQGYLIDGMGLNLNKMSISYILGFEFWNLAKPVLLNSLILYSIRKKWFKTILITLILLTISSITNPLNIVPLIMLIIFASGSTKIKEYMKRPYLSGKFFNSLDEINEKKMKVL
jgi:hypothetical protein